VTGPEAILARHRQPVLDAMRRALDRPGLEHVRLMRQHFGWDGTSTAEAAGAAGKMVRPAFCLLACEAVGGDPARAVPAAAAIELLHNFTLIHDDIEDDSDTRHGRETLWRRVGIPLAINAGDGMFVLARNLLLNIEREGVPPERVLAATRVLDDACVDLCEGQHLDLSFESRDRVTLAEYEAMIAGKTAALLGASAAVGAIAGGANDDTAATLGRAARALGMAFQVQDDVLGVWGDEAATGKPVADDIRSRKKSFPIAWALEHSAAPAAAELERLYSADMDEAAVARAVSLLDETGARTAATAAALRWRDEGIRLLREMPMQEKPRSEIEALASFFVARSS
jgi:geranylgeranyl diphosphate synthase type I